MVQTFHSEKLATCIKSCLVIQQLNREAEFLFIVPDVKHKTNSYLVPLSTRGFLAHLPSYPDDGSPLRTQSSEFGCSLLGIVQSIVKSWKKPAAFCIDRSSAKVPIQQFFFIFCHLSVCNFPDFYFIFYKFPYFERCFSKSSTNFLKISLFFLSKSKSDNLFFLPQKN